MRSPILLQACITHTMNSIAYEHHLNWRCCLSLSLGIMPNSVHARIARDRRDESAEKRTTTHGRFYAHTLRNAFDLLHQDRGGQFMGFKETDR